MARQRAMAAAVAALLVLAAMTPASARPEANTYTVNDKGSAGDASAGNGICATAGGKCTLNAAIQEANADGAATVIRFAQKFAGVDFIDGCSLTGLGADHTTIDASDRWDTGSNRPGVDIRGGVCDLLVIQSDHNVVLGLMFSGTDNTGVRIDGGHFNTIGGTGTHQRNVFVFGTGVVVEGLGADNTIIGNYFGTIDGDVKAGGTAGIRLQWGATRNLIEENVIGGHSEYGILIWDVDHNEIAHNTIGASWNWSQAISNTVGVHIAGGDHNIIGPFNHIGGNGGDGIHLRNADGTIIVGNSYIGACYFSIGNEGDGIHVFNSASVVIADNGIGCNDGHGVYLDNLVGSGPGPLIEGNGIGGNGQDGLFIEDSAEATLFDNAIGSNDGNGVHLKGAGTYGVTMHSNEIGLSSGVFDAGNKGHGVLVEGGAHSNNIGGTGLGEGNWIAWNDSTGILLRGSDTTGNFVVGNVIGAPLNWKWEAPNGNHGIGIYDGAHHNYIGVLGAGNIILSSGWSGLVIVNSDDNLAWFNQIGTDGADVGWGNNNYNVHIVNGASNAIAFNEIAYSGRNHAGEAGVRVEGALALYNTISANSIHDNGGAGIELADGGNVGLSAPSISSASCSGPVTGSSCAGCTVQIFSDGADEGRVYEGSTTADASTGAFAWSGMVNGPNVTAVAIHTADHTSPFAAPVYVDQCNTAPTAVFTYTPVSGNMCTCFGFDASASTDAEDAVASLEVRWDWDGNGMYDTEWSTAKTTSRRLGSAGLHPVRVQVIDSKGVTDATMHVVSVSGVPCTYLPLMVRDD